jgi:putative redox protein
MPRGIPKAARAKIEATAHACPVVRSLHPDVVVEASFAYSD